MSQDEHQPKGGPKTSEGKAVARMNATKHGLRALTPVIPGVEDPEEWEEHRTGILESLAPVGKLEAVFADRVALILWRLQRVVRYESEVVACRQQAGTPAEVWFQQTAPEWPEWAPPRSGPSVPLTPYGLADLARRLPLLGHSWPITAFAGAALLKALAAATGVVDLARVPVAWHFLHLDPEALSGCYPLPQLLTAVAHVDAASRGVNTTNGDPVPLLSRERLAELMVQVVERADAAVAAIAAGSPSRLMASPEDLDRIQRYEAHLNRQLQAAMHELEALQARRIGRAAPLARVDVAGLPEQ